MHIQSKDKFNLLRFESVNVCLMYPEKDMYTQEYLLWVLWLTISRKNLNICGKAHKEKFTAA